MCLTHRLLLWKSLFSIISLSKNLFHIFLVRQATIYWCFKELEDRASDAPSKSLHWRMRLEVVDDLVEIVIVRQNISLSSLTWKVERAWLLENVVNLDTPQHDPKPWSRKVAHCKTFAWSLSPLLTCRSNLNWKMHVDLMQQQREKNWFAWSPMSQKVSNNLVSIGIRTYNPVFVQDIDHYTVIYIHLL